MRKQVDGKIRRSPEEWERIFERFHESKMTAADLRRREKIARGSFEKWKKKVGRRSRARATSPAFIEWSCGAESQLARNASNFGGLEAGIAVALGHRD